MILQSTGRLSHRFPIINTRDLCRIFSSLPSSTFSTLVILTRADPCKLRCIIFHFLAWDVHVGRFLLLVGGGYRPISWCLWNARAGRGGIMRSWVCVADWETLFTFLEPLFWILATVDSLISWRLSHRVPNASSILSGFVSDLLSFAFFYL